MLFPVKLKLAHYEAEALRKYFLHMFEISINTETRQVVRPEVISIAEHFQKFDAAVRSKVMRNGVNHLGLYSIPQSIAIFLWYRWQQEDNGPVIQTILGKFDQILKSKNRVPQFPKTLYEKETV